ncbi:MAG: hypothetical protein WAV20_12130 [Blastocatellia bacterium]
MTHYNHKHEVGNKRRYAAASRIFSTGLLTLLFFLLISVGANKTSTQVDAQATAATSYACREDGANTLKVSFDGLFYFSFPAADDKDNPGRRDEGRVGILSTREDHDLYVTFEGCRLPTLVFSHQALQNQPDRIEILSDTTPGVTIAGCKEPIGWGKPRDRNRVTCENMHDFNWIIDFEGSELHMGNVSQKTGKLKPMLVFKTGCFQTKRVSDFKYYTVRGGAVSEFGYVAETTEAVITYGPGEIKFRWGGRLIPVPRDCRGIKLSNVRPEPMAPILKQTKTTTHSDIPHSDELRLYYSDLLEVSDPRDRFDFIPDISGQRERLRCEGIVAARPFICYAAGGSEFP